MNRIKKKQKLISIFLLIFSLIIFHPVTAQVKEKLIRAKDSTVKKTIQRDTLDIYKRIKKKAYKHKITKFLYHAIFIEPAPIKYENKALSDDQKLEDPNKIYEGGIIRKITIIVQDPFGYSANDTSRSAINSLQKTGNRLHILTRKFVINNLLLFHKNENANLLKIRESERLIRSYRYVNDAKIYLSNSENKSDSVDILIIVHDKWTIDPSISIGTTGGKIRLRDKNLGGLGQTFEQNIRYNVNSGMDYWGSYYFSNIKNTYISTNLFYYSNTEKNQIGVQMDRPFYSMLTKYAGGVSLTKTWDTYHYTDSIEKSLKLDYTNMDYWFASGYNIPKYNKSKQSSGKIIVALRYANTNYQKRPTFDIDTFKSNVSTRLYLGSVGYSLRKYYKDQYIYRFGANEDVPEGLLFQLLYGYYQKEFAGTKLYTGFELSHGKHYNHFGYLSANVSFGTLNQKGEKSNATLNAGINYFSNLSLEKKWYIRQFVSVKYVRGFNKSYNERITLHSDEMFGFNSGTLNGTAKMILNLSTVMYAPYNLIGFKFAPVAFMGFGMVETYNTPLIKSPIYQAYSVGLLIRNESLLNSSFEITVGMYPNMPGHSGIVYKFNPIASFTLKLRSFAISKPAMVDFD